MLMYQWLDSESIFIPTETEDDGRDTPVSVSENKNEWRLPNLSRRIRETIKSYGGGVFPKLNWTAPRVRPNLLCQQIALD